MMAQQVRD